MSRRVATLCILALSYQSSLLSSDAVDIAIQQIDKPYVLGGTGPDAFDCSGLTQLAYKQVGVTIPKYSGDQAQSGTLIPGLCTDCDSLSGLKRRG